MALTLRTTSDAVKAVLAGGQDYDTSPEDGSDPVDLSPYMRAANIVTSRAVLCASVKGITLSTDELVEIESWLGAYFYTRSDPTYQSKNTGGQSASFVVDNQSNADRYKAGAMAIDSSGCVKAILNNVPGARAMWLGKTANEQLTWVQRNGST